MYKSADTTAHIPVLLEPILTTLLAEGTDQKIYLDGTFGAGNYSQALLSSSQANIVAIDQDPDVLPFAQNLSNLFPNRFLFLQGRFSEMETLLAAQNIRKLDAVILDIGVSSMQLDRAERGFSFMKKGPLDMRMGKYGMTASELLQELDEHTLSTILYEYGGERYSRRIARAIITARQEKPIEYTTELADIISESIPYYKDTIHPATRTFQAIRIYLNRELDELASALMAAENILKPGGKLFIVTFHSLEDKQVKQFIREASGHKERPSRYTPFAAQEAFSPTFIEYTRKPILPTEAEIAANPRARSGKLRIAIRTETTSRFEHSDGREML